VLFASATAADAPHVLGTSTSCQKLLQTQVHLNFSVPRHSTAPLLYLSLLCTHFKQEGGTGVFVSLQWKAAGHTRSVVPPPSSRWFLLLWRFYFVITLH
jgi:hypothetical protein